VKITKNDSDIAAFAYDGLGRRIRKRDYIADANTIYYCNYEWQVLVDVNESDVMQNIYLYGNYVDGLVMRYDGSDSEWYFYAHDHLYSPAVLMDDNADILERYEYDAYGNVHVLDADFTDDADGFSDYDNTIYFTGRRMDTLDNGDLDVYYYRHRYYDDYTGRFFMHDPLGMNPAGGRFNAFNISSQYQDGLNLYEYARDNPTGQLDSSGLICAPGSERKIKSVMNSNIRVEAWPPSTFETIRRMNILENFVKIVGHFFNIYVNVAATLSTATSLESTTHVKARVCWTHSEVKIHRICEDCKWKNKVTTSRRKKCSNTGKSKLLPDDEAFTGHHLAIQDALSRINKNTLPKVKWDKIIELKKGPDCEWKDEKCPTPPLEYEDWNIPSTPSPY